MKKHLLSFVAFAALTVSAFAQKQVIAEQAVTADADGVSVETTRHFYNADGKRVLELVEGISQRTFTYDEAGNAVREEYRVFDNQNKSRNYNNTYNEQGQLISREELAGERSLSTTAYTYDSHGNLTATISSTGLSIPQNNTYDADGNLVKVEILHPMLGFVFQSIVYTYEGGLLTKEEHYTQQNLSSTTTYTYDADGQRVSATTTVGDVVTETLYTNGDISASLVPANVQTTVNTGNTVTLSWDAVAGAESYALVFDSRYVEVSGTEYTTDVLVDGTYRFYVANAGNTAVVNDVLVEDNTKVGVSNVALAGDITHSIVQEENRDGELVDVDIYNIPITWTLPEGSQPESYRIYYNDMYYVDVEDGSARSFVIPARYFKAWSMAQGEYVLDFAIRVVARYATGDVEPENILTLDENPVTGISAVTTEAGSRTEVFTLGGIRVSTLAAGEGLSSLPQGTYILRQGGKARKVFVK